MNQKQRDYLLATIENQFKDERRKLSEAEPKEPSLNNYLTAAILDGSFVMRSPESVRATIHARVRDLGKSEALLSSGSRFGSDDVDNAITLPALALFEEPPGYKVAREKYEAELAEWQLKLDQLDASMRAMRLKLQLGSDKALESLIAQADQLCSLSLTQSSKLLLKG